MRTRCEIIEHTRALSYIIYEIVLQDHPLIKVIVQETYRILTYEVDEKNADRIRQTSIDLDSYTLYGHLDLYMLAAKYCHKFINILTLVNENSCICHLILNAILLKQRRNFLCLLDIRLSSPNRNLSSCTSMYVSGWRGWVHSMFP